MLVPDKVKVLDPDLVKVLDPVVIGSLTVILPSPSKVIFFLDAVIELLDETFIVKVPELDYIALCAARVICADNVLSPEFDWITPLLEIPVPEIVIASATLIPFESFK